MTTGRACAANIGPAGRRARLILGVAVLALTAGIAVALTLSGADRWLRVLLLFPFLFGAVGVLQAREKT